MGSQHHLRHQRHLCDTQSIRNKPAHQQKHPCIPACLQATAYTDKGERVPFVVIGFDNLKTAVEPMSKEDEKSLLVLLLEELNSLYPVNLDTDVICDRFMKDKVFDERTMDRTDLVLIGASHLSNIAKHIDIEKWKVTDLTRPGWRINKETVEAMTAAVTAMAAAVNWDTATAVLQLFDSSIYLISKPCGKKRLPRKDRQGIYHINGSLMVVDKPTVKNLVQQLTHSSKSW